MTATPSSPSLDDLLAQSERAPDVTQKVAKDLLRNRVMVHLGPEGESDPVAQRLFFAVVNLAARIFPRMSIDASSAPAQPTVLVGPGQTLLGAATLLARAVNPNVELVPAGDARPTIVVTVGAPPREAEAVIRVDCNGWILFLATQGASMEWPVGARQGHPATPLAAAACAVSEAVKHALFDTLKRPMALAYVHNLLTHDTHDSRGPNPEVPSLLVLDDLHIVGVGSLGSAVVYCLASHRIEGRVWLIDPDLLDETNPRKYVLMSAIDAEASKVEWAKRHLERENPSLDVRTAREDVFDWGLELDAGHEIPIAIIAPDNADARRAAADLLPRVAITATAMATSVSVNHCHFGAKACASCVLTPTSEEKVDISLVWERLTGIDVGRIRQLIGGRPDHLHEAMLGGDDVRRIEEHLAAPADSLLEKWTGRRLADFVHEEMALLYSSVPIGEPGNHRRSDPHLVMAVVSAFAGAVATAELLKELDPALHVHATDYDAYHQDILAGPSRIVQEVHRDSSGRCLCTHPSRRAWFGQLWPPSSGPALGAVGPLTALNAAKADPSTAGETEASEGGPDVA